MLNLKKEEIDFREYPESQLSVHDAVPCEDLIRALDEHADDIEAAL